MKPEQLTKQIFLAHTLKEQDLAAEIAEILSEKGMKVWANQQVAAGADWNQQITNALKKSDSMIALLSPHSFSSLWVRMELEHALFDERYKNRLLPVLIGEEQDDAFLRLPWILTRMQFLRLPDQEPTRPRAIRIANAFVQVLKSSTAAK